MSGSQNLIQQGLEAMGNLLAGGKLSKAELNYVAKLLVQRQCDPKADPGEVEGIIKVRKKLCSLWNGWYPGDPPPMIVCPGDYTDCSIVT